MRNLRPSKKYLTAAFAFMCGVFIQLTTVSCSTDANAQERPDGETNTADTNSTNTNETATDDSITLPEVSLEGVSAYEAMERRGETISLSDASVSEEVVSEILWAAHGITSAGRNTTTHNLDGVSGATLNANQRYTFPVANNDRFIHVYYMSPDGVFEYDIDNHALTRLSDKNILNDISSRVSRAAGRICLAIDNDSFRAGENWGYLHVGMAAQNIYLACASNNLLTGTQGVFSQNVLRNEGNLPNNIDPVLLISFGHKR